MIFMAQKRTKDRGIVCNFLKITVKDDPQDLNIKDHNINNIMDGAYTLLWDMWLRHPEDWMKSTNVITSTETDAKVYANSPWDFVVLMLDKEPEGLEDEKLEKLTFNSKILQSTFYYHNDFNA